MSIKHLFLSFLLAHTFTNAIPEKRYTIMLDPAGDARHTGRIIGTNFERAITYQIAQALQQLLQNNFACTVLITRSPGETVSPLQNANFANRLPIDLYMSLHCYHAPLEKHTIAIYLVAPPSTAAAAPSLAMTPLAHAHDQSWHSSKKYASHIHSALQATYAHQFQLPPLVALPFAPLGGITAPALGIEINCIAPDNVTLYIEPLAKSIIQALST